MAERTSNTVTKEPLDGVTYMVQGKCDETIVMDGSDGRVAGSESECVESPRCRVDIVDG